MESSRAGGQCRDAEQLHQFCTICWDSVELAQMAILEPCMHSFHESCTEKLLKSQGNLRCPNCRADAYSVLYNIESEDDYRELKLHGGYLRHTLGHAMEAAETPIGGDSSPNWSRVFQPRGVSGTQLRRNDGCLNLLAFAGESGSDWRRSSAWDLELADTASSGLAAGPQRAPRAAAAAATAAAAAFSTADWGLPAALSWAQRLAEALGLGGCARRRRYAMARLRYNEGCIDRLALASWGA